MYTCQLYVLDLHIKLDHTKVHTVLITTHPNGVELISIDNPKNSSIQVALNRIRHCPNAIADKEATVEADRRDAILEPFIRGINTLSSKGITVTTHNGTRKFIGIVVFCFRQYSK